MNMIKTKVNLFAVLFFASMSLHAYENPQFYTVAQQPISHDWRVSGLVAGGITVATAAALLKLVTAFMKENGLSRPSDIKPAAQVAPKNNYEQFYHYCQQVVPSLSTGLLVGGLLVALCSKQLVNFYESLYKSWVFSLLPTKLKSVAEKAQQEALARS
jgi:hypothetical protein